MLTIDQIADFDRDGFVFVEGMFSIDEVDILRKAVKSASRVREHTIVAHDADDNESPLAIWRDIGEDVFGVVSASPRIVKSIRALLREDVYHWHSKVMLKYPERRWCLGMASRLRLLVWRWLPLSAIGFCHDYH